MSKILALVGSTASGKSDLALTVAQAVNAEIISCDSLLVYRDLNIGTAKPSPEELAIVPHHLIDCVDADAEFTAGDFVRRARPIIDDLVAREQNVLIVGGTGFYLKALLCGVWDAPPTHPEVREALEKLSNEELFAQLEKKDLEYSTKIKMNDRYRVVRALEIIEVTAETMTALLLKRKLQNPLPYPFEVLGIRRSKIELERRILERTHAMFGKGFVREVEGLLSRFSHDVPRSMQSVGYLEVLAFLRGEMTLPECRERILISTRQLAKKQMTFFKTFPAPIEWFDLPIQEFDFFRRVENIFGCSLSQKSGI